MMLTTPFLCLRILWDRLAVWGQMEELLGIAEFCFYRSRFVYPAWWVVRVPGCVLKSHSWESRAQLLKGEGVREAGTGTGTAEAGLSPLRCSPGT